MELTLPKLVTAQDYHYFHDYEMMLRQIDKTLRCAEVGFDEGYGCYIGVVYAGRKPSKSVIASLPIPN